MGLFDDVLPQNQGVPNQQSAFPSDQGMNIPTQQGMFQQPMDYQGSMGIPNAGGMGFQNSMTNPYAGGMNNSYDGGMSFSGFNSYDQMGITDRFGNIRYSKSQIIQGLRDFVMMQTGKAILEEQKLEDTPELLRHACAEAKISKLGMLQFPVPEMGLVVPFYFCTACCKLFYPKDIL